MFDTKFNFVKPGLMAGLVMLLVSLVASVALHAIFPQIAQEYGTQMFRSWTDPLMLIFFLHPFILGLIISWIWDKTSLVMKGDDLTKAVNFTFAYMLVAQVPGMFITFTSMNVSLLMIMGWVLTGLLQVLFGSILISKMNKKKVSIF